MEKLFVKLHETVINLLINFFFENQNLIRNENKIGIDSTKVKVKVKVNFPK